MMKTQLNLEDKVGEFVGDFNKFFEKLKEWTEDSIKIDTWREFFEKKYPKMFSDSSENEVKMDVDVDTTMENESRPIVDREEKLQKVEEKLLRNKTKERFTTYDGVMSDDGLTLPEKVKRLQKATDDAREEKSTTLRYKDNCLKNAFFNLGKFIKKL